jgi:hypothetical protein
MPVSDICVLADAKPGARPAALYSAGERTLGSKLPCAGFTDHYVGETVPSGTRALKSGNKLPTIVQKVYLRLGKKLHEFVNKFYWGEI